jgi:hypothetical protein
MPSEQDAAQAYCRQGGRVTTPADVKALEAAAQPRYAQLERDPQTRELITQIRGLARAATDSDDAPACSPSSGAAAPSSGTSQSAIPDGVYRNHITVEEFVAAGVNEASARDNAGVHTIELSHICGGGGQQQR